MRHQRFAFGDARRRTATSMPEQRSCTTASNYSLTTPQVQLVGTNHGLGLVHRLGLILEGLRVCLNPKSEPYQQSIQLPARPAIAVDQTQVFATTRSEAPRWEGHGKMAALQNAIAGRVFARVISSSFTLPTVIARARRCLAKCKNAGEISISAVEKTRGGWWVGEARPARRIPDLSVLFRGSGAKNSGPSGCKNPGRAGMLFPGPAGLGVAFASSRYREGRADGKTRQRLSYWAWRGRRCRA